MKFDVAKLKDGPIENELDEKPSKLDLDVEDVKFRDNIKGKITAALFGKNIVISGNINGLAELECVRCLEKFPFKINSEVNLVYSNDSEFKTLPDEINPEEEIIFYFDGPYLDTSKELRDTLLLEVPNFPLCNENCQGLCTVCGANKNINPCKCKNGIAKKNKPEPIPLWKEQLKTLKTKTKKKKRD